MAHEHLAFRVRAGDVWDACAAECDRHDIDHCRQYAQARRCIAG